MTLNLRCPLKMVEHVELPSSQQIPMGPASNMSLLLLRDLPGAAILLILGQNRGGRKGGTGQADKLVFQISS